MITDSFRNIFHVEIYGFIGFIIFFTFFILVTIRVFRMKKDDENKFSLMPFDDAENLQEK